MQLLSKQRRVCTTCACRVENLKSDYQDLLRRRGGGVEGVSRSPIESVMNMFPQSSTTMSHRQPMYQMAIFNDLEGITRLLDEGVDPAADEERAVCLMMGHCVGWTGGRVSLWCVVDALLTVYNRTAGQLSMKPPSMDTSPWCSC